MRALRSKKKGRSLKASTDSEWNDNTSSGSDAESNGEDDKLFVEPAVLPSDAHSGLFEYFIPFVYRVLDQFVPGIFAKEATFNFIRLVVVGRLGV